MIWQKWVLIFVLSINYNELRFSLSLASKLRMLHEIFFHMMLFHGFP